MPRLFNESRWLQKFTDLTLKADVYSVCQDIWTKRETVPYPDVVRARILMLALEPVHGTAARAMSFAKAVEVKHSCLWNYFTRDVGGWADRMRQRLGRKDARTKDTKPKRVPLTQRDLQWIGGFLSRIYHRHWSVRLGLLRSEALHSDEFKHLGALPRSTFWDHRHEVGHLINIAEAERAKCKPKRVRTPRERHSVIVPHEFLEPEAVHASETVSAPDSASPERQWTGNPF